MSVVPLTSTGSIAILAGSAVRLLLRPARNPANPLPRRTARLHLRRHEPQFWLQGSQDIFSVVLQLLLHATELPP